MRFCWDYKEWQHASFIVQDARNEKTQNFYFWFFCLFVLLEGIQLSWWELFCVTTGSPSLAALSSSKKRIVITFVIFNKNLLCSICQFCSCG